MSSSVVSPSDPVESALTDALTKAVATGSFDAVRAIVDELAARRKARAGVVDLDTERRRREGR